MTLVAAVLLLSALSSKVAKPVALVALGSTTSTATSVSAAATSKVTRTTSVSTAATSSHIAATSIATSSANIASTVTLGALSGKVARPVTTVAHRLSPAPAALGLVLPDDVIQAHVHLIHCGFQLNQFSCRSESSNK